MNLLEKVEVVVFALLVLFAIPILHHYTGLAISIASQAQVSGELPGQEPEPPEPSSGSGGGGAGGLPEYPSFILPVSDNPNGTIEEPVVVEVPGLSEELPVLLLYPKFRKVEEPLSWWWRWLILLFVILLFIWYYWYQRKERNT
jgi:hypothetical protein